MLKKLLTYICLLLALLLAGCSAAGGAEATPGADITPATKAPPEDPAETADPAPEVETYESFRESILPAYGLKRQEAIALMGYTDADFDEVEKQNLISKTISVDGTEYNVQLLFYNDTHTAMPVWPVDDDCVLAGFALYKDYEPVENATEEQLAAVQSLYSLFSGLFGTPDESVSDGISFLKTPENIENNPSGASTVWKASPDVPEYFTTIAESAAMQMDISVSCRNMPDGCRCKINARELWVLLGRH